MRHRLLECLFNQAHCLLGDGFGPVHANQQLEHCLRFGTALGIPDAGDAFLETLCPFLASHRRTAGDDGQNVAPQMKNAALVTNPVETARQELTKTGRPIAGEDFDRLQVQTSPGSQVKGPLPDTSGPLSSVAKWKRPKLVRQMPSTTPRMAVQTPRIRT